MRNICDNIVAAFKSRGVFNRYLNLGIRLRSFRSLSERQSRFVQGQQIFETIYEVTLRSRMLIEEDA